MLLQVSAGRTWSPFSICSACKINLHLQMWNLHLSVSGLSYPAHIHECAFHVSVMQQSPYFFSSQFFLSYGNSPLPPNIFSCMPGSWGWSRVF